MTRLDSIYSKNAVVDCLRLTKLPELPETLEHLNCNHNLLIELPKLPSSLIHLSCWHNNLTELPQLPNLLNYLDCVSNKLEELPYLPNRLVTLLCNDNNLRELPQFPKSLLSFNCYNNNIKYISFENIQILRKINEFDKNNELNKKCEGVILYRLSILKNPFSKDFTSDNEFISSL